MEIESFHKWLLIQMSSGDRQVKQMVKHANGSGKNKAKSKNGKFKLLCPVTQSIHRLYSPHIPLVPHTYQICHPYLLQSFGLSSHSLLDIYISLDLCFAILANFTCHFKIPLILLTWKHVFPVCSGTRSDSSVSELWGDILAAAVILHCTFKLSEHT